MRPEAVRQLDWVSWVRLALLKGSETGEMSADLWQQQGCRPAAARANGCALTAALHLAQVLPLPDGPGEHHPGWQGAWRRCTAVPGAQLVPLRDAQLCWSTEAPRVDMLGCKPGTAAQHTAVVNTLKWPLPGT